MKNQRYLLISLIVLGICNLSAQSSRQSPGNKPYTHLAQFKVYDYASKSPISQATIINQSGEELGVTGMKGDLALNVPPDKSEYYTIRAAGYNEMNIRLAQAERKKGDYEVFLPVKTNVESNTITTNTSESEDLVKVYVKQDPATYQKKNQGGEIMYAVQIAASSKPISEKSAKDQWSNTGRVYVHQENGMYKVRIGPFESQNEAKNVLLDVKSKGKKDAFIVVMQRGAYDAPAEHEELKNNSTTYSSVTEPVEMKTETTDQLPLYGEYKVKIASYLHPGKFNPEGIDQLGTLESYRKGEWTIMMIGGFKNLDTAREALNLVIAHGFTDAGIVRDNGGILEDVEEK